MDRIKKVLDNLDVKYDFHEVAVDSLLRSSNEQSHYGLVEFWTETANQDIPVEIDFDGTAEDFVAKYTEYANNYNVEEEVELFIGMMGERAVPSSVTLLVEDIREAKDTLMKIAKKLQNALDGVYTKAFLVNAHPYADQVGTIEVPEGLSEEERKAYIEDHWDDISFGPADLDYCGTEFEISEV